MTRRATVSLQHSRTDSQWIPTPVPSTRHQGIPICLHPHCLRPSANQGILADWESNGLESCQGMYSGSMNLAHKQINRLLTSPSVPMEESENPDHVGCHLRGIDN